MTESDTTNFSFSQKEVGRWTIPVLEFANADRPMLYLDVTGMIVNSIVEGDVRKEKQRLWKVHIARSVKAARGGAAWNPEDRFAISVSFSFNINSGWHGYRPLDVENFVKPIMDALAAGLFCADDTDPNEITKWGYDDSNFNTLLIHRLDDAPKRECEGIAICVSSATTV